MADSSTASASDIGLDQDATGRSDSQHMRLALELARHGLPRVSPNPRVGVLIVQAGEVVGQGTYERFGGPHAEIIALDAAGESARGATLYTTLEPCSITGKTPPCTEALIKAGIKRVVVAVRDPNPRIDGRGITFLRAAGIAVTTGILAPEAAWINRGFFKWITTGKPYVILKVARTVDNFVVAQLAGERWFTSAASKRIVHKLRAEVDGVMVGRRSAEVDNPRLTVRDMAGTNPHRIVMDSRGRLAPDLSIFTDGMAPTLCFTGVETSHETSWGEHIRVPPSAAGLDLEQVMAELGSRGMTTVLVEGGPRLHRSFLDGNLADEIMIFTTPQAAGPEVRRRPARYNAVEVPPDWQVVLEEEPGGDRLVVAQAPETNKRIENLLDHQQGIG